MMENSFLQWLIVSITGIFIIALIITRYKVWFVRHPEVSPSPIKPNGAEMGVAFRSDFFNWFMANEHHKSIHQLLPEDLRNYPFNMTFGVFQAFFKHKEMYLQIVDEIIGEYDVVHWFRICEFDSKGIFNVSYESFVGHGSEYTGAWGDIEETMENCIRKSIELYEKRKG